MKYILAILIFSFCFIACTLPNHSEIGRVDSIASTSPLNLVNPFIGTGGWGFGAGSMVPGPQMPNGMIRPGPDTSFGTSAVGFQHFAGYFYPDTHIRGFSHTRLVGVGMNDQGNVRLMPVMGEGDELVDEADYRSTFSHANEEASPGYYRVLLDKFGIQAELSAAKYCAIHRYSFPKSERKPYVIVDAGASIIDGDVKQARVTIDADKREVAGELLQHGGFSGAYGGLPTYFAIRFSEPFVDYGTFRDGVSNRRQTEEEGARVGAYIGFAPDGPRQILVKVAISFISVVQARQNLMAEMPNFDFEDIAENCREAWRQKLALIDIVGGTEEQRKIFYSALYHAYMLPTLFTEQGDRYMGFDGKVHIADDFTYYTDFSLWDTFRTFHPLMTLIEPQLNRNYVVSLLKMYEQGGSLPMWPMGRGYTDCMIGTHADAVIAEAYIKGITDFDVDTAYRAMNEHANRPVAYAGRDDLEHYLTLGYCTTDHTEKAPSKTLEYAFDDYCIGALAQALGRNDDAEHYGLRAKNFRHLWDPQTQFLRGRDSLGEWKKPFCPRFRFASEYVEGNAWHWLWFVPQDPGGLIELFGSPEAFTDKLEFFFEEAAKRSDSFLPDTYYWHGNEPDIHAAYLFNYAGRPDLTQKWVRWILANKYKDSPDGIDGNDDGGTLSAWYIFSALGFYPLNPCSGEYVIGSPLFAKATLHLPEGNLVVIAENASTQNFYVQQVALNGEPLKVPWFEHSAIANGGELHFTMGPMPSEWGR